MHAMSQELPNRNVMLSAVILVFAGASSLTLLVVGMFDDALLLDVSILALPVGYGLLMGNEASRSLARLGCAVVLMGIVAGFMAVTMFTIRGLELDGLTWSTVFSGVMWTLLSIIVFVSLRKNRVGEWFAERRSPGFARSCTLSIALVAGCFTVDDYLRVRDFQAELAGAFPVLLRIEPRDADTGAGIYSVSLPPQRVSSGTGSPLHLYYRLLGESPFPRLAYPIETTPDGITITAVGVLLEPTEIVIASDGYQDATVWLDREMKSSIRLPMTRDPNVTLPDRP